MSRDILRLEPAPGPAPAALVSWAASSAWRAFREYWPPVPPGPLHEEREKLHLGSDPATIAWRRHRERLLQELERFTTEAPLLDQRRLVRRATDLVRRIESTAVAAWRVLLEERT